ncbi:5-methyltetrahydropteroyltriglutamate--homocysteine S-methyltransferase [Thermosynechococcus vestitus]|uniref:5-methyltetrahydropteroyltriglutamate--homocysteine methyltransferase n=1 Tax=Thermosynechococcus vestitus (strain NIES-2133 / IAM M-273 / BP-1) TaxID=197221 RepID=METE_THEVB|nr:5-methyltetrahydropteroyltriglutamate--homocysteine S-methyltransferase [Thermosynechococcus vestitus]Q8DJY0.1 RecName: Full=5-methyltetrahydropteroyltriglutamate--homocysteine methyltransferase; AltName: Full=Cobalamin-independent methionine synthase; AltName: Full=Methionine synthase, vitamin-B12 independent isozyme [Thermosynechococcus vestitus BP-1]BAC08643.1 5-methyltetrahydropteroyltriglutamate--homocysteine S-methyltransferase [Thermosynechococcus vestitus BP-1]
MTIQTATLGYPRIGKNRELKKALEAFWSNQLDAEALLKTAQDIELQNWQKQLEVGIDRIGIGDLSLYDSVLDWSIRFGIIPERYRSFTGLEQYFAMARGKDGIPALEMTKWFDTNYHYLVPEISEAFQPTDFSDFLETVRRAQTLLGDRAVPIVLGPLTLLRLSRLETNLEQAVSYLRDRYLILLRELKNLGVVEVQIHEPALVLEEADSFKSFYQSTFDTLRQANLPLHLVTYFDDLGAAWPWVMELPVTCISLDFTRGHNLALLKEYGFPADKQLGVGIIDGRNIWKIRPESVLSTLETIQSITANIRLHPSSSLQFVPYDAKREVKLPEPLRDVLSFAEQKLDEVVLLARVLNSNDGTNREILMKNPELTAIQAQWKAFEQFSPVNPTVQARLRNLSVRDLERPLPYEQRRTLQPTLPPLPTTTIGSFPQTAEVRQLRVKLKRHEITQAEYEAAIDEEIAKCVRLQEEVGLDVLVHGEFERSDMVEFFGQQLSGFAFTEHGWVQSYGSRCVRPPIIYGDIARPQPMTVREFKVAQSLTDKIVKAMLTGPVTMINWSFTRTDIPRSEQAMQIALALRDEVADLEAAGAKMIQIDEPALREGLPLKAERWNEYLSWAVDAFRLAAGVAKPETQIHTHMCYSEFGDIIEHIERLDADVLSIENSRSNNETLFQITDAGYRHQVGVGVYDVHSPAVPSVEQLVQQLRTSVANLAPEQIWVNPDCGLKTRHWEEVIPSLKNMVEATKTIRQEVMQSKNNA